MNKSDVKTKCKYKRWMSFFWGSWKYESNASHAKLMWRKGHHLLCTWPVAFNYFHEVQKNKIYFLNVNLTYYCFLHLTHIAQVMTARVHTKNIPKFRSFFAILGEMNDVLCIFNDVNSFINKLWYLLILEWSFSAWSKINGMLLHMEF